MQLKGTYPMRLRAGGSEVWDPVRRKYVALTPEEFVRQQLIAYLHLELGYAFTRMQVEKGVVSGRKKGRIDLAVFDRNGKPLILAECKRPEIPLAQQTIDQAARYNLAYRVPWLVITNGHDSRCYHIRFKEESWEECPELPAAR